MFDWQSIGGWFDWKTYYESVVANYAGGVLVEVGAYLGRSLCCLGQLVKDSGKPFHVVGVEIGTGSGVENGTDHHGGAVDRGNGTLVGELHRNVLACGLADVVTLVVADSVRAASLFAPGSLTMVFLDAAHDYDSVVRDIESWRWKLKPGGALAGDDYGTCDEADDAVVWPGVRRAVKDRLPGHTTVPHDGWEFRTR